MPYDFSSFWPRRSPFAPAILLTLTTPQRPSGWLQVQDSSPLVPGKTDVTELSELYHNFKDDKGFSSRAPFADKDELTAHVSPGYPLLLGFLARALDEPTLENLVRWSQAVLGTLTAGLYFLFARRAFQSLFVGALTGFLCAVYPFYVINTAVLADGTLASFLLAFGLFLGARGIQTGGPLSSLLYGLTMAALAMVRAACLPFAFIAVAWYLLRSRSVTRGWLCALLAFLGYVNGLVPWTVRNYQVFQEPIPIVDSAYYHLWIGNNPDATGGPVATEAAIKNAVEREQRDAPEHKLADLSQPERYGRLGRLVRDYWKEKFAEGSAICASGPPLISGSANAGSRRASLGLEAAAGCRQERRRQFRAPRDDARVLAACLSRYFARRLARPLRVCGPGLALVVRLA